MTDDAKGPSGKDLLAYLRHHGLDKHGSAISADEVRQVLNIDYPELASRETFQELAMLELGGIDYVRRHLLREGKYLAQVKGDYRILLPSENSAQVASYMQSADKKLKRALILTKYTPVSGDEARRADQTQARIHIQRESIKDRKTYGRVDAPSAPIPPSQRPIPPRPTARV